MYICGKFMKDKTGVFDRRGVCKEISIAVDGNTPLSSLTYNTESGKLEVHTGNNVICITDRVGILEESVMDFVLMKSGICFTLREGYAYVDNGEGSVIRIGTAGQTSAVTGVSRIYWLTKENLESLLMYPIVKEFSISPDSKLTTYLNNLTFTCTGSYATVNGAKTFTIRCTEIHRNLGMTEFVTGTVDPFNTEKKKSKTRELIEMIQDTDSNVYEDDNF